MRINSLKLKNYRQFKDVEVNLNLVQSRKDLHIMIGVMGVGKSNLLNAVNWCLYGEEPFLSREDSRKLPQLNVKILRDASEGDEYRMTVEINAESGGKHIAFIRDQYFKMAKGSRGANSVCRPTRQVFKAVLLDENGNSKIFQDEEGKKEATEKVDLLVPYGIKDFFFFDGERLDKYFREATGQNIRNAIYQISQVELLDRTQTHMQKVISDLHKDAGKTDPEIEKTRKELERLEDDLSSKLEEITPQMEVMERSPTWRRRLKMLSRVRSYYRSNNLNSLDFGEKRLSEIDRELGELIRRIDGQHTVD